MWDLIVSVPDHCLSFYFSVRYRSQSWWVDLCSHFFFFCNLFYQIYTNTSTSHCLSYFLPNPRFNVDLLCYYC